MRMIDARGLALALTFFGSCGSDDGAVDAADASGDASAGEVRVLDTFFDLGPASYLPGQTFAATLAASLEGWTGEVVGFSVASAPQGIDARIVHPVGVSLSEDPEYGPDIRSSIVIALAPDLAPGRYEVGVRIAAGAQSAIAPVRFDVVAPEGPALTASADRTLLLDDGASELEVRVHVASIAGWSGPVFAPSTEITTDYRGRTTVTPARLDLAAGATHELTMRCPRLPLLRSGSPVCATTIASGRTVLPITVDVVTRPAIVAAPDLIVHAVDIPLVLAPGESGRQPTELDANDALAARWQTELVASADAPPGLSATTSVQLPTVHVDVTAGPEIAPGPHVIPLTITVGEVARDALVRVLVPPSDGPWPLIGGRAARVGGLGARLVSDERGYPVVTAGGAMWRWQGSSWSEHPAHPEVIAFTPDGALIGLDPDGSATRAGLPMPYPIGFGGSAGGLLAIGGDGSPIVVLSYTNRDRAALRGGPSWVPFGTLPGAIAKAEGGELAAAGERAAVTGFEGDALAVAWFDQDDWELLPSSGASARRGATHALGFDHDGALVLAWVDLDEVAHALRWDGSGSWREVAPPVAATAAHRVVATIDLAFDAEGRAVMLVLEADHALWRGARARVLREADGAWQELAEAGPLDHDATLANAALAAAPDGTTYVMLGERGQVFVRRYAGD